MTLKYIIAFFIDEFHHDKF